jgi:hypothetical protein
MARCEPTFASPRYGWYFVRLVVVCNPVVTGIMADA